MKKSVRYLIPFLIIPFLIGCQEEISDPAAQRLNLIGDGSGTNTFMLDCMQALTAKVKSGETTAEAGLESCRFKPRGVANRVREAGGARGFYSVWSAVGNWWSTGYWWPGYQQNCDFNNGGYSCMNYDYYYPWYYNSYSLGNSYNVDFSLFCGVASFSPLCSYFGYYGNYASGCSECLTYASKKKRRRCLRQTGCISDSVSTITWNEDY